MDDQNSQDFLKDLVVQQDDVDSETDDELAEKVAGDSEMCRQLFNDTVRRCDTRPGYDVCVDESDFTADSEHSFDVHPGGVDVTDETSGFNRSSAEQLSDDDTEFFSGPAEWRHVWEWEVGECNRVIAEQNTQQYDDVENCTDSSESVDDVLGSYSDDDTKERPFMLCRGNGTWTLVGDSDDMASAVSSSVVVTEPVPCMQSTDNHHADTNAVYDREVNDNNAIQSVLDDVLNSCLDEGVTWDSGDESGLTELDKQSDVCDEQFSQDFTRDSSQRRVLSMCIPVAGSSRDHQDRVRTEDNCMDTGNGFISGFASSSMFAQRPSYSPGAHSRSMDSKWNPPRTPPAADNDSCRWKSRKSWRKNSAGNATFEIFALLANSDKD